MYLIFLKRFPNIYPFLLFQNDYIERNTGNEIEIDRSYAIDILDTKNDIQTSSSAKKKTKTDFGSFYVNI